MPNALTAATVLTCPHGGTVSVASGNSRVKAKGTFMLLATDTYSICGCPFQIGPKPSPCLTVQWIVKDTRTTVGGLPTLSQSSIGLCLSAEQMPQGTVVISGAQPNASST